MLEELIFRIRKFFDRGREHRYKLAWESCDLDGLEMYAPHYESEQEIEVGKYLCFCCFNNIDYNEMYSLKIYKEQRQEHFEKLSQYFSDETKKYFEIDENNDEKS